MRNTCKRKEEAVVGQTDDDDAGGRAAVGFAEPRCVPIGSFFSAVLCWQEVTLKIIMNRNGGAVWPCCRTAHMYDYVLTLLTLV